MKKLLLSFFYYIPVTLIAQCNLLSSVESAREIIPGIEQNMSAHLIQKVKLIDGYERYNDTSAHVTFYINTDSSKVTDLKLIAPKEELKAYFESLKKQVRKCSNWKEDGEFYLKTSNYNVSYNFYKHFRGQITYYELTFYYLGNSKSGWSKAANKG